MKIKAQASFLGDPKYQGFRINLLLPLMEFTCCYKLNRQKLSRHALFDEKCIPFTNNTSHHLTTHDIITSLKGNY